jgi:hypothetical protein
VVSDAPTWVELWKQVGLVGPAPSVDFSRKLVIVAAMGMQRSGGYSIEIEDVSITGDDAVISVVEVSPGSGCYVTEALTAPLAVVAVPRFAGHASFRERSVEHICR